MKVSIVAAVLTALVGVGGFANRSVAENEDSVRIASASPALAQKPKFTFILFWKENSAATQGLAESVKSAVASHSQRAQWTSVNVGDDANREVVQRYQVSGATMPVVLCVAPNGAITGAITRELTDVAVERVLVTPAMADVTKALQEKKIVIVHVKHDVQAPLPVGVVELMADPAFRERTTTVSVVIGDPVENRFVNDLKIRSADVADSMLVVLGPRGVLVGKFPASATKEELTTSLNAPGKCCNNPNCKKKQQGQ